MLIACPDVADDMILSLCPTHLASVGVSGLQLHRCYYLRDAGRIPFDFSYNRYPDCDSCSADSELLYHCSDCRRRWYRCGSPHCTSTPGNQDCPGCEAFSLIDVLSAVGAVGDGPDTTSCFHSVDVLFHEFRFWPDRWVSCGCDLSLWFRVTAVSHPDISDVVEFNSRVDAWYASLSLLSLSSASVSQ